MIFPSWFKNGQEWLSQASKIPEGRLRTVSIGRYCMVVLIAFTHYPKYDDNVCSKLFLSQEQNNFRSCCP